MGAKKISGTNDLIDDLYARVKELQRQQAHMCKEISRLKPVANIEGLEERIKMLNKKMAILWIKDSVMSEVAYCDREAAQWLWVLRDMPDEFWVERKDWTINKWVEQIRLGLIDEIAQKQGGSDEQAA